MKRVAGFVAVLCLFAAIGCSRSTAGESAPAAVASGPSGLDVGTIVVTLGGSLSTENRTILTEVNGAPHLKGALEGELTKIGKLKSGSPRTLEVEMTDFRLRSGATVWFAGVMSGVDSLDVQVNVREGGRIVRTFKTGAASAGIFNGLSSAARYQPIADEVAARVAKDL